MLGAERAVANAYYAYDPSNPGAELANEDRFILGNSNPTWFGGVNNTVTTCPYSSASQGAIENSCSSAVDMSGGKPRGPYWLARR